MIDAYTSEPVDGPSSRRIDGSKTSSGPGAGKVTHAEMVSDSNESYTYAVVYEETYHTEGDQRSRDCPGHGYPASSETFQVFKRFKTKEEFEEWILRATNSPYGKKFDAFICRRVSIMKKTEIQY